MSGSVARDHIAAAIIPLEAAYEALAEGPERQRLGAAIRNLGLVRAWLTQREHERTA